MTQEIQPLRLAVGSHVAGSGKGCAMNVISWENGDTTISDFPECSDSFLARLVQIVNDGICLHREGDLLCADCSVKVLALGHRTVGTSLKGWNPRKRINLYAQFAKEFAALASPYDIDAQYKLQDVQSSENPVNVGNVTAGIAVHVTSNNMEFYNLVDDTITRFIERTGVKVSPVPEEVVTCAITKMAQFR